MIHAHQFPDEAARSSRGCPWVAECEIGGIGRSSLRPEVYTARSRSGAPYALARVLVEAGIPDSPMVVISQGTKGEMRYRSFHAMAGYTIEESVTVPVRRGRFVAYAERPAAGVPHSAGTSGQIMGESADPGISAPPEVEAA